jgi:hypothetical protein
MSSETPAMRVTMPRRDIPTIFVALPPLLPLLRSDGARLRRQGKNVERGAP